MKLRIMSDLHLEFDSGHLWEPPSLSTDKETTLILAGDIFNWQKGKLPEYYMWLEDRSYQFANVIHIAGNHEFYGGNIEKVLTYWRKHSQSLDNVFFLENKTVELENLKFAGTTLWTNFGNDPLSEWSARLGMNDFRQIKVGSKYRRFNTEDWKAMHYKARDFLRASEADVVISHHSPSHQSVAPWFLEADNNSYASHLEMLMVELNPKIWVHGHMHNSSDYNIENTRVIANPRGYAGHELNPGFQPDLVIEV